VLSWMIRSRGVPQNVHKPDPLDRHACQRSRSWGAPGLFNLKPARGRPLLTRDLTRRIEFAPVTAATIETDDLIHEVAAIVGG
jgi:hypothetical protein